MRVYHSIRHDLWAAVLFLCAALTPCTAQTPRTYTLNADFDVGALLNVQHDIPDQLQLTRVARVLPFINVAASERGTVVRIDVNTGQIVGEYRTAPEGRGADPSRTTVDFEGNVWVGNRAELGTPEFPTGSVTKIGIVMGGTRCDARGNADPGGEYLKPPFEYCTAVDRNGDGLIHTSRGLLDIRSWKNPGGIDDRGGVSSAEDECILVYARVPPVAVRHVSVDLDNGVWIGALGCDFYKLTADGDLVDSLANPDCGGYGGLVDANGMIWSANGRNPSKLYRGSPATGSFGCYLYTSYGMTADARGNIWVSGNDSSGMLWKLQPDGGVYPGFPKRLTCGVTAGVASTPKDGNIWVACRGDNTLMRFDSSGTLLGSISMQPNGAKPTGVAVDSNGRVWVTNLEGNTVMRINPDSAGGIVDWIVFLEQNAGLYNYSDMTGLVAGIGGARSGTWTVTHEGMREDARWGRVSWTESLPPGATITVYARADNDSTHLPRQRYRRAENGVSFCDVTGRFLQLRVLFGRGPASDASPVLYDLTVDSVRFPTVKLIEPDSRVIPCNGFPVTLMETSGFTPRRWSTGDTADNILATGPGTYTVTVWWTPYCPLSDTITLGDAQPPKPRIGRSGGPTLCLGDSVQLYVTGARGRVSWSSGQQGDSITVRESGLYGVTVTDSLGCTGSDTLRVEFQPLPRPDIAARGPLAFCEGDSVELEAPGSWASCLWSSGDTGSTVSVTRPGLVTVTVTDANGCMGSDTVLTSFLPRPWPVIVRSGPAAICEGDSAVLSVTPPFASYRWSTGDSAASIIVTLAGIYRVTVTDSNGCSGDTAIAVSVLPAPKPSIAGPGSACTGSTVLFAVTGLPGRSWTWQVGAGGVIAAGQGSNAVQVQWTVPGRWRVTVTETNTVTGCRGSTSFEVRVGSELHPVIAAAPSAIFCEGDSVVLDAGIYATYAWSNGATTRRITVRSSGAFAVRVTDGGICAGVSDSIRVSVHRAVVPLVSAAPSTSVCQGDTVRLTAGGSYASYQWSNGDTSRGIAVTASGTFTVRVADSIGCVAVSAPVTVAVHAHPIPVITGPTDVCAGDSAILETAPFAVIRWITPSGSIAGPRRITALLPGIYEAEVTDSNGCTGRSLPFTLAVHALPQALVSGPSAFCEGDSIVLDAGPGMAAYRWTLPGGDSAATRSIIVTRGGAYTVTVTDSAGCSAASPPFAVTEHPRPPAPVVTGHCMELRSSPSRSWQWLRNGTDIPGATDSLYLAVDTGSYRVRITDANGCSALSDEYRISVPFAATAIVQLPQREAAPGEHVSVPIGLTGVSDPALCGTRGFRAVIRFDASILLPAADTDPGVLDGRDRLITITRPWTPPGDPLAVLEFTAALGSVDRTPLHIESFAWDSPLVTATLIDGEFLLRVCREGGTRLFDDSGRFALHPNSPNPFNAQTTIEFELIEAAPARLVVTDALGRVVAVLFDAVAEPGTRRLLFDASALPSGVYHLLLSTPSGLRSRSMLVVK